MVQPQEELHYVFFELFACGFKEVRAKSDEEAVRKMDEMINSFNVGQDGLSLRTDDGVGHLMPLADCDIKWKNAEEEKDTVR